MSNKIWDVVQPKDEWGRNYAHLEFLRIGIRRTFATIIHVQEKVLGDYYDMSHDEGL